MAVSMFGVGSSLPVPMGVPGGPGGADLELSSAQIRRVDVLAALEPTFVADNTRNTLPAALANDDESGSGAAAQGGQGKDASRNDDTQGRGWMSLALSDPASALSALLSTVQVESKMEATTAGLRHTVSADEGQDVLARLARQLAALGLSADQAYHALAYKRTLIVKKLFDSYSSAYRDHQLSSSRYRKLAPSKLHTLLVLGIKSGVHTALSLLHSSAVHNPALSRELLRFMSREVAAVAPLSFSLSSAQLPVPDLSGHVLNSVQSTLFQLCQPSPQAPSTLSLNAPSALIAQVASASSPIAEDIRQGALELMLSLAVARGCLPDLLTIVKLLLLRTEDPKSGAPQEVHMLQSLIKLQRLEKASLLDLPSQARLQQAITMHELRASTLAAAAGVTPATTLQMYIGQKAPTPKQSTPVICASSRFLFVYCVAGLFKIGAGGNKTIKGTNAVAGTIVATVPNFHEGEQATMACVGDRLYWRSTTMPKHTLLVIDCETLKELGTLSLNGNGSVPSEDNSAAFLASLKPEIKAEPQAQQGMPAFNRPGSVSAQVVPVVAAQAAVAGLANFPTFEHAGFGTLTSDGHLLYSMTAKPAAPVADELKVSAAAAAAAAAAEEKKEEMKEENITQAQTTRARTRSYSRSGSDEDEEEDDEDDESDEEDQLSAQDHAERMRQEQKKALLARESRSTFVVHAFDPVSAFKLVHSVPLYRAPRSARAPMLLAWPAPANLGLLPNSLGGLSVSGEMLEEDANSDSESDDDEPLPPHCNTGNRRVDRRNARAYQAQMKGVQPPAKKPPMLWLGIPTHLRFEEGSSFGVEVWLKLNPATHNEQTFRNVCSQGSASRLTFVYVCSKMVIAGSRSASGLSIVKAPLTSGILNEWFHIAVSFDATKRQWAIYLNGIQIHTAERVIAGGPNAAGNCFTQQNFNSAQLEQEIANAMQQELQMAAQLQMDPSRAASQPPVVTPPCAGPCAAAQAWVVGAQQMGGRPYPVVEQFFGSMRELRFWNCPRNEESIKQWMAVGKMSDEAAVNETGLLAFYRLDDGIGLTVHDASRYANTAFMRHCVWKEVASINASKDAAVEGIVQGLAKLSSMSGAELGAVNDMEAASSSASSAAGSAAAVSARPIPYSFSGSGLEQATIFTQGEQLAVLYRPAGVSLSFPGSDGAANNQGPQVHVVSLFSLATGELQSESEYLLPNAKAEARAATKQMLQSTDSAAAGGQSASWLTQAELNGRNNGGGSFGGGFAQPWDSGNNSRSQALAAAKRAALSRAPVMLSACIRPGEWRTGAESMWVITSSDTENFREFIVRPPAHMSAWRKSVGEKHQTEVALEQFPSIRALQAKYVLPTKNDGTVASSGSSNGTGSSADAVPLRVAVMQILMSLALSVDELGAPVPNGRVPASLILPLAVDLSPDTFVGLLELTELLVRDYYRPQAELEKLYGGSVEARMFCLLTCVRLLKSNIAHLVAWNVDPLAAFSPAGSDVQSRFSSALNRIIFEQPTASASRLVAPQLIDDVTAVLGSGFSIFYTVPDRISILKDLLDTALVSNKDQQTSDAGALQRLLLNSYLVKITQPEQTLALIPAFLEATSVSAPIAHPLLSRVYQLIHRATHAQLEAYFARFGGSTSVVKATASVTPIAGSNDVSPAMRFLLGLTIGLLVGASRQPLAASNAAVGFAHAVEFVLLVVDGCVELLNFALANVARLNGDVRFDPMDARELAVQTLAEGPLLLLQPLLSCLFCLRMNAPVASRLLPRFLALLEGLNNLQVGLPSVAVHEAAFVAGQQGVRTSLSKTAQVESPHPAPATVDSKLSIPGATSMTITISPTTQQCLRNGATIVMYRKPHREEEIARLTNSSYETSVHVRGDIAYICYSAGLQDGFGFQLTANAEVSEVKLKLPLMLDITKNVALMAGRLSLVLVRGVYAAPAKPAAAAATKPATAATKAEPARLASPASAASPSPTAATAAPSAAPLSDAAVAAAAAAAAAIVEKWMNNELLQEGVEVDEAQEAEEVEALAWLPRDASDSSSAADAPEESSLLLKRAGSYRLIERSPLELARLVDKKLLASGNRAAPFPIAAAVAPLIVDCVMHVFGVLLKHNMCVSEANAYVSDMADAEDGPSENIMRSWRAAYKLRGWLLQRYQEQRNAVAGEVKPEDEDGLKLRLYTGICNMVLEQCKFLLSVVPVPMRLQAQATQPNGAPSLNRQGSSVAGASSSNTADASDPERQAKALLAAWNQSKSTISLREANPEERFNLLWRSTLNFLQSDIDLAGLRNALRAKRDAARVRAAGYAMICRLLNVCKFGTVKRELIACISPALNASTRAAYEGQRGAVLQGCRPSNEKLEARTRAAFRSLFQSLLAILQAPEDSGSALLCAILHNFSLQYSSADLDLVVSLGLFPLLNSLLLTFSKAQAAEEATRAEQRVQFGAAATASTAAASLSATPAAPAGSFAEMNEKNALAAARSSSIRAGYHSAWTLLDLIMSTVLTQSTQSASTQQHMSSIHSIVATQLAGIAEKMQQQAKNEADTPQYVHAAPANPWGNFGSYNPVTSFGGARSGGFMSPSSGYDAPSSLDGDEDATSTDVLNVVDKLAFLPPGRARISESGTSGGTILSSLIAILRLGSARARIVVLRILRRLCTSAQAPQLSVLDACFSGSAPSSSAGFVESLLNHVGGCMSAPALAASATQVDLMRQADMKSLLTQLRLFKAHSNEGVVVHAEELMLLRCLAQSNNEPLTKTIVAQVKQAVEGLPAVVAKLVQIREARSNISERSKPQLLALDRSLLLDPVLLTCVFRSLGALSVIGGYTDNIRVGSRVRILAEGCNGTIVAVTNSEAQVLRDEEGSIVRLGLAAVVSLSDVPFNAAKDFAALPSSLVLSTCCSVLQLTDNLSTANTGHTADMLITPVEAFLAELRTRTLLVLSAYISTPALVADMLRTDPAMVSRLTSLAVNTNSTDWFTSLVEYQSQGVLMELIRRTALPAPWFARIQTQPKLPGAKKDEKATAAASGAAEEKSATTPASSASPDSEEHKSTGEEKKKKHPKAKDAGAQEPLHLLLESAGANVNFPVSMPTLQQTCFGTVASNVTPAGAPAMPLMYLPINDDVDDSVSGHCVLIDTYEARMPLKQRLLSLIRAGAKTVLLGMHSQDVAQEGLAPKAVLEARAKNEKEAERKREEALRAARQASDVTVGAAARGAALREAAGMANATTPAFAYGAPGFQQQQQQQAFGASPFGASTSTSAFGSSSAFSFADEEEQQFGGGGGASLFGNSTSSSHMMQIPSDDGLKDKKKKEEKVVEQTLDDLSEAERALIQSVPVLAMTVGDAQHLRGRLQVQDRDQPEHQNRTALYAALKQRGYTNRSHCSKALKKNGHNLEKALAWLSANKLWLEQTVGDDDSADDQADDDDDEAAGQAKKRASKQGAEDEEDEAEPKDQSEHKSESGSDEEEEGEVRDESATASPASSPAAATTSSSSFGFSTAAPSVSLSGVSLFGSAPAPSSSGGLFGSTAPARSAPSLFGATAPARPTQGLFGNGPSGGLTLGGAPSGLSMGGGNASGSLFGSAGPPSLNFGAPPASTGFVGFGGRSAASGAPSLISQMGAATHSSSFGGFGSAAPSGPPSGGMFGAAPAATGGFGAPPAASAPRATGFAFGSASAAKAPSASAASAGPASLQEEKGGEPAKPKELTAEERQAAAERAKIEEQKSPEQRAAEAEEAESKRQEDAEKEKLASGPGGARETAEDPNGDNDGRADRPDGPRGAEPTPSGFGGPSSDSDRPRVRFSGTGSSGPSASADSSESRSLSDAWSHFGGAAGPVPSNMNMGRGFAQPAPRAFGMATQAFATTSARPGNFGQPVPPRATGRPGAPAGAAAALGGKGKPQWGSQHGRELLIGSGRTVAQVQASDEFNAQVSNAVNRAHLRNLPTSTLLAQLATLNHQICIAYARRSLISVLAGWPADKSLREFASPVMLAPIVHVALAFDAQRNIAAETEPEAALAGSDFRATLLRALRADATRSVDSGYLNSVLLADITEVLTSSNEAKPSSKVVTKSNLQVSSQPLSGGANAPSTPVHVNTRNMALTNAGSSVLVEWDSPVCCSADPSSRPLYRIHCPDSKGAVVVFDATELNDAQHTIVLCVYSAERTEIRRVVLKSLHSLCNQTKLLLLGPTSYYSLHSDEPSDARLQVHIKFAHIKRSLNNLTVAGNLYTSLSLLDVLLCNNLSASSLHKLTLLLLSTLAFVRDQSAAQLCCTMSAKLFNRWRVCRSEMSEAEWKQILDETDKLAASYHSLRLQSLAANWNNSAPSVHLQILLELVLAARTAIDSSAEAPDSYATQMVQRIRRTKVNSFAAAPSDRLTQCFTRYRECAAKVSLICLNKSEVTANHTVKVLPPAQQNNSFGMFGSHSGQRLDQSQTYLGSVCVRGGGQWYYEVTVLSQQPGFVLSPGWVQRKFKFQDRTAMQSDQQGTSFCFAAPGNYFCGTKQNYGEGSLNTPAAMWATGAVFGMWLDLDKRTMSWSCNGRLLPKEGRPAVLNAIPDCPSGWYPAVSVGNCEVEINFGSKPFKFHPNDRNNAGFTQYSDCPTPGNNNNGFGYSGMPTPSASSSTHEPSNAAWNLLNGQSPDDVYCGLEDPSVANASFLDGLLASYQLLQSLAERKSVLPASAVQAAVASELLELQKEQPLAFELVGGDLPSESRSLFGSSPFGQFGQSASAQRSTPNVILTDSAASCDFQKSSNVHLIFQLTSSQSGSEGSDASDAASSSGSADSSFVLQSVTVRAIKNPNTGLFGGGSDEMTYGVFGLVFLSDSKPADTDCFEYCNDWKLPQYKRFIARKTAAAQEKAAAEGRPAGEPVQLTYLPHEPVGFISNPAGSTSVTFHVDSSAALPSARFLTLKLSTVSQNLGINVALEHVKICGRLSSHPLSTVHGAKQRVAKVEEIRSALLAGAAEREPASGLSLSPSHGIAWSLSMDEALVSVLQSVATRTGVDPTSLDAVVTFRPTAIDLSRYPHLQNVPLQAMRSRVAILKYANRMAAPLLGYCHGTESRTPFRGDAALANKDTSASAKPAAASSSSASKDDNDSSLSSTVRSLKGLYFLGTKKSVFESLLTESGGASTMNLNNPSIFGGSMGGGYSAPRISVNRIRASRLRDEGRVARESASVFHQIWQQMRSHAASSSANFRNLQVDQQVWNVSFQGEGSIDVGGPFRESMTNICADLMSANTDLLLLCPNGTNGVGLNRSTYVPNPSAVSTQQLQQFEFIGQLMGIALRTRLPLGLDLPSTVWKSLLEQPLDVSDLESIDKLCVQALSEIGKLDARSYASMFNEQKFVTQLSDHSEFELRKGGRDTLVSYEAREEFTKLSIDARLQESSKQIASIKKGLHSVVPLSNLALFTWTDLQLMVCGNPAIDVDSLRRHTVFKLPLTASDDVVVWLFKALHSFSAEERQLFLRFVWGRNRLPATDSDWGTNFTINSLSASVSDESLPISHTCFFSIDLPSYSSYDTLRKKLLYAILNCQAIDVDFNPANADATNAWVD